MASVYVIATMDTKGHELAFVAQRLRSEGISAVMVDVGTLNEPQVTPDVDRGQVSAGRFAVSANSDRGSAVSQMSDWLTEYLQTELAAGNILGVLGIGGSGGTALITRAMRGLRIGLPKLMVSTVASGNVAAYVDCHDITMMYSVVDIAGLNSVSQRVLANAAAAMAGMATQKPLDLREIKRAVGMTMFGVTTPCVNAVRQQLESEGFDALAFHATGSGGRAMEQLVSAGLIQGVLDITTTEIADEIAGGIFAGGPERLDRLIAAKIPLVLSLGAMDMVNFGALETVPEKYRHRMLHVHNPQITLMRTNVEENRKIGQWMAHKLNRSTTPLRLLIPEGGLSLLDQPGGVFYDPEADQALFESLREHLLATEERVIETYPLTINSPEFVDKLIEAFHRLVRL